ncbi:hypothetical protein [Marinomonas balearica]|uniref:Uncharacterized protein n=1 Tax=Marinomonas balearica TaxID=491947 RepID=A0A4R6M2E2_9GAMM|nr:hypothetical protein [Marinomonas balearica]TDO95334.1 hypothetical protein DFP79_3575 [Marinomonas balearica]
MNLNNDYYLAKPKSNAHVSDIELDFFHAQLEAHLLFAKWIKAGIRKIVKCVVSLSKASLTIRPVQFAKR